MKGQESNKLSRLPDTTSHTIDGRVVVLPRIEHLKQAVCCTRRAGADGRQREHAFLTLAFHMCCGEVTISILHIKHLLLTLLLPLLLPYIHPQAKQRRHQNACHKYLTGKQTLMLLLEAEYWGPCKIWIYFVPYSCTAYARPISLTKDIQATFF